MTHNKFTASKNQSASPVAVSLFSGAGGFDHGFVKEGFNVVFANDINPDAVATYRANYASRIVQKDIREVNAELKKFNGCDALFGGPPCQGFSVAGRMNPEDERSQMIWEFAKAVEIIQPKAFVMENVKALGRLAKWKATREKLLRILKNHGYEVQSIILNASDFGVPQARERVMFIGVRKPRIIPDLRLLFHKVRKMAPSVRDALSVLDRAGAGNNKSVCNARVTLAANPVMRRSPYAGMLFNGLGRPVRLEGYCPTLPASMGGNKTPIIDADELYLKKPSWIENYHAELLNGASLQKTCAPARLRRLTVEEAALLQGFPLEYVFCGSQSSKYTQIGNSVPPGLAAAVAKVIRNLLYPDKALASFSKRIPEQGLLNGLY